MTKTYTLKDASDKLGIARSTLGDRADVMEEVVPGYARLNGKRCFNEKELKVMAYVGDLLEKQSGRKDIKLACEKAKEIYYTDVNVEEAKRKLIEIINISQETIDLLK